MKEKRRFGFLGSNHGNTRDANDEGFQEQQLLKPSSPRIEFAKGYNEILARASNIRMPCSSNSSTGTSSTAGSKSAPVRHNSKMQGKENSNAIPTEKKGHISILTMKTPRMNNTRSTSTGSSTTNVSRSNPSTVALPGIFVLMDQNNWKRVAQRARKYRKECRITGHVKRSQHYHPHSGNTDTQPRRTIENQYHNSCNTMDTNFTNSSQVTATASNKSSFNPNTHVKCKALHHACHRLRRVHGHIRKRISESLKNEQIASIKHNNMPSHINQRAITPTVSLSFQSISSFESSVSEDGYNLHTRSAPNAPSSSPFNPFGFNAKKDVVEEWDDPWIEACKAILTIIEQYPEAAGQRESRHGCLPLHLAVFAMCPTPDVQSVEQMCDFGNVMHADINMNMNANIRDAAPGMNRNSAKSKQTFSIAEDLPPPRPLMRSRRFSNSSAGSSVGTQSLDEFSAAMERELPLDNTGSGSIPNAPSNSRDRDLTLTLERLEAQLRLSPKSKLSKEDEAAMLESARILSGESPKIVGKGLSRPMPLGFHSGTGDNRSISIGSQTSNCSNSVATATSSIYSQAQSPRAKPFNLKKYIADEARREEFSLRVLNALLDAFPRGVKLDSEGGRLPLHTAVAGKATLKVIESLIRAYPHACRHRNNENSLPIHIAACYGVSDPNVAPMLLKFYPDGSVGKNRWGRTPYQEALLMAGLNGKPYQEDLCHALRRSPEYWSNTGGLGPSQIMGGYLNSNSARDVEYLLQGEFRPNGARRNDGPYDTDADFLDMNDLFALIRERRWDAIVQNIDVLQSQATKRIKSEVRAGYVAEASALYLACEQEPTYEVLDALVNACPVSTTWRKLPGGELPLHAACTWGASRAVVGFLLAASSESSKQRDNLGNLPLHCACYSGASKNIIESLLCTNPKAANARNVQGSTPRDIVSRLSHSNRKEILNFIEDVSLELLKKKRQLDNQKQYYQRQAEQNLERQETIIKETGSNDRGDGRVKGKVKKPFLRLSRKKSKDNNSAVEIPQVPVKERKMNITRAPPPEENIEIELAEEGNDGMLWV